MSQTAGLLLELVSLLRGKGASVSEAIAGFDKESLRSAMFDGGPMTEEQRKLLDLCAEAVREDLNDKDLGQAIELWMAGWTHEPVTPTSQIMSWYWRAPAKGKRAKGRRYLSTQQALNALHRTQPTPSGPEGTG